MEKLDKKKLVKYLQKKIKEFKTEGSFLKEDLPNQRYWLGKEISYTTLKDNIKKGDFDA